MALDIKICGLKTNEAVEAAIANGASHIGFIFFPKSPRNISFLQAAALCETVAKRAKTVAVTVDADNLFLDDLVHIVKPDMLQLHGHETPRRVAEIKKRYNLPVMKAISVHTAPDLQNAIPYREVSDRILFDAKAPQGSNLPGGNGVSFDWQLLNNFDSDMDYMLSGGLRIENIHDALTTISPSGIDVSSGVESEPGVKDLALMNGFFNAVQNALIAQQK
ncbi:MULTISPECIES: phosphoribosylanthranilate isomerase [unclassified Bartonella]|uniref:phosphoribosylanthranilate isomerase n=1 Tax=unclassified Bartonella TaxID=2645622 RepID=UPI0015F82780|nr:MULTISPECIES: phosphoribosylanthranilate isomerase [unclassified Bartonella]UXN03879.1 phosphoribosylanthranilate isomerase [Bartonella sp. HY406]UXN06852.1 phosphoribosylanthranilate isomerase [Bartonella sp. HY761]